MAARSAFGRVLPEAASQKKGCEIFSYLMKYYIFASELKDTKLFAI